MIVHSVYQASAVKSHSMQVGKCYNCSINYFPSLQGATLKYQLLLLFFIVNRADLAGSEQYHYSSDESVLPAKQ